MNAEPIFIHQFGTHFFFSWFTMVENNVRFIQASIKDEDILLVKSVKVSSTPEADFTSMASSLDAKTPVYILFNAGK
jgi:hypothetical protein